MSAPTVTLSIPDLADDVDMLTAALAYAACGWYVLPVSRGTKHPGSVVGEHWQDKSSRDPKQIAAWFAGTDYEHRAALRPFRRRCARRRSPPTMLPDVLRRHLDAAPYQSTRPDDPGRGHYVFLQPPGRTLGNGLGRLPRGWGEVRGLNGVIKVFPSSHADGGQYRWERT